MGPFADTGRHVAEHLVALLRGGQRPHLGVGVQPRADGDLTGQIRDALDHLVEDTARSMSSAAPCATHPRLSSVAGFSVSKVLPLTASTHSPSIKSDPACARSPEPLRADRELEPEYR